MGRDDSSPLHERIRRRRDERGIPAYALAQRLGISPSYMSLIESGKKVPGEDIARRIAEALDDDVGMYVAWTHASGINDLDQYADRLMRLRRYSSDPELRRRLMSGEDIEDSAPVMAKARASLGSIVPRLIRSKKEAVAKIVGGAESPLAEIPLLEEGADPESGDKELRIAGPPLQLDSRFLPEWKPGRLFAYRATLDMAKRAGGSVRPGDWLILTSRVETGELQGIFAVRTNGRIVLSRVLLKGKELLLLPSPDSSDFEIVALEGEADLARVLAGRVVMKLREM